MEELRIFIADDSEAIRQQLKIALSLIDGLSLVGMAAGNIEAAEPVKTLQPDVVVLDISKPHREGIEVLREIRKGAPRAEIIIFTSDPSVVLQEVCLEAGANFYLHKTQIRDLIDICSGRLAQR